MKSNRWSDFSLEELQEPQGSILTFDKEGERPQQIHLEKLFNRPQIGQTLKQSFWLLMQDHARKSRSNIADNLKLLYDFLDWKEENSNAVSDLSEFDSQLFHELSYWLSNVRKLKVNTAHNKFCSIANFLKSARRLNPQSFSSEFNIPKHVFPKARIALTDPKCLQQDEFELILRVAETKVRETIENHKEGEVPEDLIALIPFMILLAAQTAINPFSLYELERNCLSPHPLDESAFYVGWTKRRSGSRQRQLHYINRKGGVIDLIRFLLKYTDPLVEKASEYDRSRLLLYRYHNHAFGNFVPPIVMAADCQKANHNLKAFIRQNNLPDFRINQIRPTVATLHYKKTGGNIRKAQILLGHKDIYTTQLYIGKELVQPVHNLAIKTAQEEMVGRVIVIPKAAKTAVIELSGSISIEQQEKIANGEYDTGYSKCRDPFNSPQPGQKKGKACTLFHACLTCPNALFFLEDLPRVIAIKNRFLSKKSFLGKDLWKEIYGYKVNIIEQEIIGAFNDDQIAKAEEEAMKILDIPIIEAEGVIR